jgi:hypothetical protein
MTDGKTRARDGIEEGAVGAAEIDKEVLDLDMLQLLRKAYSTPAPTA